ncbi:MAG: hypothetical protein M3396_00325 [Actinomycetota bacterium]|nr:hypothetical protein [Actinomycetota bacterium]
MTERQTTGTNWSRWLIRGGLGGIGAGGVFVALTMWFATSVGDPAKGPLLMISTIVKGDDAMANGTASVGVGLALHLGLSALFGLVFAVLASRLRTNGSLATAGALYGAGLYLLNFKVLTPLAFPVFKMANQPFELVVHVVFGTLLSFALFHVSVFHRAPSLPTPKAPAGVAAGARPA